MLNHPPSTVLRIGKGLLAALFLLILAMTLLQTIDLVVFQKLFYLRTPIITALLLLTFPVIAFYMPAILANLFVLQNKWRLAVIIVVASISGLGILLILDTLSINAPCRLELPNCNYSSIALSDHQGLSYFLGVVLALPVILTSIFASEITLKDKLFGSVTGFIVTASLMFCINYYAMQAGPFGQSLETTLTALLNTVLSDESRAGFIDPETGKLTTGHLALMNFFVITGLMYIVGFFFYRPSRHSNKFQIPALCYLLIIMLAMTFVFGLLTFLLDYYRIPVLTLFIATSCLAYHFYGVDHYYRLRDRPQDLSEVSDLEALKQRLNHQGDEKTLVVVCTTGGGIQAAGWTTKVLTGLQQLLGKDFSRAIGCISSVSGGSVGTMHYLDRFGADGVPDEDQLNEIFNCATKDSLDATGWGLAYPDLWRIIGLPFLAPALMDRGSALETDWKSVMKHPDAKLSDWQEGVAKGRLPITLFNATQVDNGRRFLMTPVKLGHSDQLTDIDFNACYPEYDIDVTTAARLSATFSYVSPICRNDKGRKVMHIADGGYFDNYGVFTAAEWLETDIFPRHDDLKLKRVVIVEIHAFAAQQARSDQGKPNGWLMAVLGPLLTLAKVRTATQDARNHYDLNALVSRWDDTIKLEKFTLAFPKQIAFFEPHVPKTGKAVIDSMAGKLIGHKKYDPPLSWKLSKKQKSAIERGWKTLLEGGAESELYQLKALWDKRDAG